MKKNSILVKHVLMSALTAATFGLTIALTACSDDLDLQNAPETPESTMTRSIETPADRYNINEDKNVDPNPFDRTNWRDQSSIYLRVSDRDHINPEIVDGRKNTGYMKVRLPWSDLSCKTNLPNDFCEDITPTNGWELVANYCGEYGNPDAHYFVLYNKYMGKLRYFYYIPVYVKLNNAADHNFEIHMQKGMAEHSVFGYAVPTKRNLSDPGKIGALQGNYLTQYVTPWTASVSKLGQLAPVEGWYAFDIDISVYRGAGNTMKQDGHVQTNLRGYNTTNVEMYGNLKAGLTGNIDMKECCVNNQSGAFGPIEDLLGKANDVKDFFNKAKDLYSDVTSGNILGFYEGGIGLAKQGCDLLGIDYGGGQSGFKGYQGEVNLKLNGTLDFNGKFQTENVIQGLSSITQPMADYNFSETNHMGEGIWNIEDAPVIYCTNAYVDWYYSGSKYNGSYKDIKSPFGGQAYERMKDENCHGNPHAGRVCYFDPASVKLVLNPNIFTQDEIQNAKVYATCGVRKNAKFCSTDSYRLAQGLSTSNLKKSEDLWYFNQPTNRAPFDALLGYKESDKTGTKAQTKFDQEIVGGTKCALFGRGDADYLIEPIALRGNADWDWMPAYEVTVTVMVNHDGKQMVFSRNYLPEFKTITLDKMPNYNHPASYLNKRPANYIESVYFEQYRHLGRLYDWLTRTLQPYDGNELNYMEWGWNLMPQSHGHASLFDDDNTTAWCLIEDCTDDQGTSSKHNKGVYDSKRYTWWTEFYTNAPVKPWTYTMVTGRSGSEAPTEWAIYAKTNKDDSWTRLDYKKGDFLPNKPTTARTLNFTDCPHMGSKAYKWFRLEIYNVKDNDYMSLADFHFNYL